MNFFISLYRGMDSKDDDFLCEKKNILDKEVYFKVCDKLVVFLVF